CAAQCGEEAGLRSVLAGILQETSIAIPWAAPAAGLQVSGALRERYPTIVPVRSHSGFAMLPRHRSDLPAWHCCPACWIAARQIVYKEPPANHRFGARAHPVLLRPLPVSNRPL